MDAIDQFNKNQIFALTLAATAGRASLYAANTSERIREIVQRDLKKHLETIAAEYLVRQPDDAQHLLNIQSLSTSMSQEHKDALGATGLNIGHAQKALNLFLKYQWTFFSTPEPPHFPIDYRILQLIPSHRNERWTRLTSIDTYSEIICAARRIAGGQGLSLAMWELEGYNQVAVRATRRDRFVSVPVPPHIPSYEEQMKAAVEERKRRSAP